MIRTLFNIYPGEEKNALSFVLLGFLWALGVSLGWKNGDALFLLNVGADQLPIAYGLIAAFMIAIASLMIYAYNEYAVHRIFVIVLVLGIVFYSLVYASLIYQVGIESKWLWYALRIFGWIFFSVANTTFWTFIDQFYHLSDSKRLFSLFASAVFVGIASTGLIMQSGLFELNQIMLAIIGILLLTILWIAQIMKTAQPIHSEHDLDAAVAPSDQTWQKTLASVFRSKFTITLMILNFIGYVSLFLTEFNYMLSFQDFFAGEKTAIASEESAPLMLFLGKCIAFVNLFNIAFGLFIYSRLVRRFGVNAMLLITPFILILTYSGWFFSEALLFPLMAFFVCESTYYVIDDNNFNLLLNGVPAKLKYKIRICIESFFEPVGTLTCALLLSLFPEKGHLLALIIAITMMGISLIVRTLYPKAVYHNLTENAVHFEKSPKDWLSTLSKKEQKLSTLRLLAILKIGDIQAQDLALEALIDFEDPTVLDKMLTVLDQASLETKQLFIRKLGSTSFSREMRIIDQLTSWDQEDIDPHFRSNLHLYLAKQGLLPPQKALLDLKSSDPKLQCAALIALKKSAASASPYSIAELRVLSAQHLQDLLSSEKAEDNLMGLTVLSADATGDDVNIFIPFLNHPNLEVVREAAKTIADIATPRAAQHAKTLLQIILRQSDNELRLALLKALGKIADTSLVSEILESSLHLRPSERRMIEKIVFHMGLRTVPLLLTITKDSTLNDKCRLLAVRILGKLALPQLRANLMNIISKEINRAFFYFFYYHTIQSAYPQYDLRVLNDTLLASYHSVLDFIIQLLGIAGEVEDSELLSHSLRSENPKVRSQVIETLERTCEPHLFRLIQPLVDEIPLTEKLRSYPVSKISLEELLEILHSSPSTVDQIAAAAVSSSLQLTGWRETLKKQMAGKEEIFHHFAYEVLET